MFLAPIDQRRRSPKAQCKTKTNRGRVARKSTRFVSGARHDSHFRFARTYRFRVIESLGPSMHRLAAGSLHSMYTCKQRSLRDFLHSPHFPSGLAESSNYFLLAAITSARPTTTTDTGVTAYGEERSIARLIGIR